MLHTEALNALLNEVMAQYRVDEKRVYLTGLSMGGAGTWFLAGAYPERFAAIAPICARYVPLPLPRFKSLPAWAFHGELDETINVSESQRMIAGLKALDADVQLTVYPGVGHFCWQQAYDDPALYDWFLSHSRP